MKTILVPFDLSDAALAVCDEACALAKRVGAKLHLIHVVEPYTLVSGFGPDGGYAGDMLTILENLAETQLETLLRRCAKRGVQARGEHRIGNAVQEILQKARRAAYLVIGSHGHGAVYDLMVGSTTHGVLKRASCPVLVVAIRPARR